MKKVIALILVAILIAAVLVTVVACGGYSTDLTAENMAKDATVTVSDNTKKAGNVKDGKSSTWTTKTQTATVTINFNGKKTLNTIVIKEPSDCVSEFNILYRNDSGEYVHIYKQDRIDKYRMCAIESTNTDSIKIVFDKFSKTLKIEEIEVYNLISQNKDFKVNAYLSQGYSDGTTDLQKKADDPKFTDRFKVLTDVTMIGTAKLDAAGNIVYGIPKEVIKENSRILKSINPNIKVHATVMTGLVDDDFGANKAAIVKLVNNDATLAASMANIRKMTEDCDLDGIDYDWEYPQLPHEWAAYDKLLINTKKAIAGRELSVALWPYGVNLSKEAMACIDTINIMAYDQFDDRGDHASIYEMGLECIQYFKKLGFANNQLSLGVPFYARTADKYAIWPMVYEPQMFEVYDKWTNFKNGYEYTDADGNKQLSTAFYNSYAMIRDKTALALAYDLGGLMIFSSTCDLDQDIEYNLHSAVEEVLNTRIA